MAAKGVRHLKVKITKGSTYMVVKVTRLVPGNLHFKLKAAEVGSGAPEVTLTTQVSQSKSRHSRLTRLRETRSRGRVPGS